LRKARQREALVYPPGSEPFIFTYAERFAHGPPLARLQGTGLAVTVWASLVGVMGLGCIFARIRQHGVPIVPALVTVATVGLATLWGPYSTMLFNHVTAASVVAGLLLVLDRHERAVRGLAPPHWGLAVGAGTLVALAVATDYLLLLVVVPLALLRLPPARWPALALGALPVVAALAGYHTVAFGAPWSIGYDHQAHFAFAQTRAGTFSGSLPTGLWTLLGAGRDAGVLVLSPVLILAAVCLWPEPSPPVPSPVTRPRFWLSAAPWIVWVVLLALHRSPWGGEGSDHRYLIPLIPVLALGLAHALTRRRWRSVVWTAFVLLATISIAHVWIHFLHWRGGAPFAHQGLGLAVGLAVGLVVAVSRRAVDSRAIPDRGNRSEELPAR